MSASCRRLPQTRRVELLSPTERKALVKSSPSRIAVVAANSGVLESMEHGQGVRLANQARVKVEVEIQAAIRFGVVNRPRHQEVSRVMVAFRFHEAGVERGQHAIDWQEFAGEDLKFFATPPFDERTANQMVDHLVSLPVADGFHQAGNPRTRIRLAEGDAAAFEQIQHELEVLQFLDGDGVEFCDARIEVAVFLQVQRRGGRFALQVRVVHEDRGQIRQDFRQPVAWDPFAKQQHGSFLSFVRAGARRIYCVVIPTRLVPVCFTRTRPLLFRTVSRTPSAVMFSRRMVTGGSDSTATFGSIRTIRSACLARIRITSGSGALANCTRGRASRFEAAVGLSDDASRGYRATRPSKRQE